MNPPSTSTVAARHDEEALDDLINPLLQLDNADNAAKALEELEKGIYDSGFGQAEIPTSLISALTTLRRHASRNSTSTVDIGSAPVDSSVPTGTDRIDLGRLYAKLKRCTDKGDSAALQAIWMEYKDRLTAHSEGEKLEKWRDEMLAKILSACLRCERKFKSVRLKETISDITASAPKPLPTDILNVILAHRADVDAPVYVDEAVEGEPMEETAGTGEERARPALKSLRLAWNMSSEQGTRKDMRSYMIYIEGLARSGDIEGLRETWAALLADEDLKSATLAEKDSKYPPIATFNHMISSAFLIPKTGPPFALDLFDRAVQAGTPSINIITINTVLRHHARMADIQSMTSLFSLASQRGLKPDVVTYTTLVQGLLRAERVEMAKSVLAKMLSEGLEPNERLCSLLVADLARSGSQAGLQRAEEMMNEMRRKRMTITQVTWTSLISGYFRGGWQTDAWAALDRMGRSGVSLNRVGYNIILKHGQGSWCLRMFERMIKEGVSPNSDTYLIVLTPLVHKKQWDEADGVVREMARLGFRPEKGALRRLVNRVEARR